MTTYSKKHADKFNRAFEEKIINKPRLQCMNNKLEQMGGIENTKNITDMTVTEILIGLKDTWFGVMDDMIKLKLNKSSFTRNNGLFFIGLTLVVIVMIMFLYEYISSDDNTNTTNTNTNKNNVVEIRHLYQIDNQDPNAKILSDVIKGLPALSKDQQN
jgi:hypothetical protein